MTSGQPTHFFRNCPVFGMAKEYVTDYPIPKALVPDLKIHSARVGDLAAFLGRKIYQETEQVERLRAGGYLHDFGKLFIAQELLRKETPLTDRERRLVRSHPWLGAKELVERRLAKINEPHLFPILLSHHERWDGYGYPYGKKGTSIPFVAQIVSLADTVEALTANRVYRPAWVWEQVLAYVDTERSRAWSSGLVDVFLTYEDQARRVLLLDGLGNGMPPSVSAG